MGKKESHAKSQRKHAIKRFLERFHKHITIKEYELLLLAVKNKTCNDIIQSVYIGKESCTRSFYKITFKGITCIGVYHKDTKEFCTFLPENYQTSKIKLISED